MASINQGDDAVERLDNAVTAFEQIMTGPEGQTVQVPGNQPQPTLAERVKQNLKPSTDAAAGFAAQASASAKAADDSAKLASQIAGLSTVADAIGMAALPLPDVWAPLSDSLRLITGYGREVKVGEDVVARMVNFSRSTTATYIGKDGQLKTAAANEPRFEKEGLLIEGQSTNLIVSSEKDYVTGSSASNYTVETGLLLDGRKAVKFIPIEPRRPVGIATALASNSTVTVGWHTASFLCDVDLTGDRGYMRGVMEPLVVRKIRDGLYRASVTVNIPSAGASELHIYPYVAVTITGLQLEALPFASSYIPTNGAAVTRTADLLTLQNPLNIPVGAGDMTVAFEVRRNPVITTALFPKIFHIGTNTWLVGDSVRFAMRGGTADQGYALKNAPGTMETVVYRIKGDQITVRCANAVATLTRTGAITANNMVTNIGSDATGIQNLFGHVRNMRVWHRALTDDQMKAIS